MSVTEPSGLAYCEATRTLYMISDGHAAIYRIDTTGAVLGSIPVNATDLEGIATSEQGDTLYAVEETPSLVSTFLPNGTKVSSFSVLVRTEGNHSLEGITRGPGGRLVVVNEQAPTLLLEFAGSTETGRIPLTYTADLSDICYDRTGDCYWIISDESQKIIKISRTGALLGEWATTIQQGEGIAFIGDRMYCVSDIEAKLYVYRKPQ
jgi:uncharacterized protein YjiK